MKEKNQEPKLFDYINSFFNKKYIENLNAFVPFVINRFISSSPFLMKYVFIMNLNNNYITKEMVYDFYFYSIPKKREYLKYPKKQKEEDLFYIQKWFDCSLKDAQEYVKILSNEQIKEIKKRVKK